MSSIRRCRRWMACFTARPWSINRGVAAPIDVHDTPESLGDVLASSVLEVVRADATANEMVLLGCPGGRSLRPTYEAIGRQAARHCQDLSRLIVVMMDEYLVASDGKLVRCSPDAHYSCRRFGLKHIRDTFNAGLPPARQVSPENVWLPDPTEPEAYDRRILAAGGICLFLLASGVSDGHVAFNPARHAAR